MSRRVISPRNAQTWRDARTQAGQSWVKPLRALMPDMNQLTGEDGAPCPALQGRMHSSEPWDLCTVAHTSPPPAGVRDQRMPSAHHRPGRPTATPPRCPGRPRVIPCRHSAQAQSIVIARHQHRAARDTNPPRQDQPHIPQPAGNPRVEPLDAPGPRRRSCYSSWKLPGLRPPRPVIEGGPASII